MFITPFQKILHINFSRKSSRDLFQLKLTRVWSLKIKSSHRKQGNHTCSMTHITTRITTNSTDWLQYSNNDCIQTASNNVAYKQQACSRFTLVLVLSARSCIWIFHIVNADRRDCASRNARKSNTELYWMIQVSYCVKGFGFLYGALKNKELQPICLFK